MIHLTMNFQMKPSRQGQNTGRKNRLLHPKPFGEINEWNY